MTPLLPFLLALLLLHLLQANGENGREDSGNIDGPLLL
jgi:hypothetical protein